MVRSLTTWLWLVDIVGSARALDASAEQTCELASSLQGHYGVVDVLRPDEPSLARVRASNESGVWRPSSLTVGTIRAAPWPAATFDCIAVHDALTRETTDPAELLDDLRSVHRLLREGGLLALSSPTRPIVARQAASRGRVNRRRLTALLRTAGFDDVRCFLVEPDLDRPMVIIPDDTPASQAYESYDAMRSHTDWKRKLVARLGLRSVLYPAYLLVARA